MDRRISAVVQLMRERLSGRVTVPEMARVVNVSPSRLRQLFSEETGRSPSQYLRMLRMQQAQHLLDSTFLSVKEVAALSGATSVGHFAKAFEVTFGLTPAKYRARQRTSSRIRKPVRNSGAPYSRNGR